MEINVKKKTKRGKWIILYSLICLFLYVGIILLATESLRHNSSALKKTNEADLNYQSVNSQKESNIIIWNSKKTDEKVVRVDAKKKFFRIMEDAYYDNQIFFQYQYVKNEELVYGIGKVNVSNGKVALYDMEDFYNYQWNSLGIKNGKLYILMNDIDNRILKEYKVSLKNEIVCEQEIAYPDGKIIINSKYYNGNINICLDDGSSYYYNGTEIVNYENLGKSPFGTRVDYEIDDEAGKLLRNEHFFDLLKRYSLIFVICTIILGMFIGILAGRKPFVAKMLVCTEIMVIAILIIVVGSISKKTESEVVKYIKNKGVTILENVSEKINASGEVEYKELSDINNNSAIEFEEILLLERTTDSTVVKAGLQTPKNIVISGDGYFGKSFSNLINEIDSDEKELLTKINKGNKDFIAVIVNNTTDVNTDRIIIGFVNNQIVKGYIENVVNDIAKRIIILAFVCNLIVIGIYLVCMLHFRKFSNALLTLVKNHDRYQKLKTKPLSLKKEWNALDEVKRILSSVSYEKVQSLDMYNKFVPRNFEKLLGRRSLLDIELGDVSDITGSVVTINMDEDFINSEAYIKTAGNVFEIINSAENKQNGVIITQDSRLIDTKLLFRDDVNSAIDFAIEVMSGFDNNIDIVNKQKIIVVNYSNYICGATGCEERIVPYVYSNEENIIINYVDALRRAGIKIILTESAVEKSKNTYEVRYIGYITENDKNIKIYECLDAYSPVKKELLISTRKTFKKALGLFYSNDFYLARNTFNEVLKVNPDDNLARWYLFNCEHNLNNSSDSEISYGLFENKVYEQQYQIK